MLLLVPRSIGEAKQKKLPRFARGAIIIDKKDRTVSIKLKVLASFKGFSLGKWIVFVGLFDGGDSYELAILNFFHFDPSSFNCNPCSRIMKSILSLSSESTSLNSLSPIELTLIVWVFIQ